MGVCVVITILSFSYLNWFVLVGLILILLGFINVLHPSEPMKTYILYIYI